MVLPKEVVLEDMVRAIVSEVAPRQIILFGSQARGDAGPESDVDLLIVEDGPFDARHSRRREMARIWRLLARFPVSQDLLVCTPQDLERWRGSRNHVIARAVREGRILYARP